MCSFNYHLYKKILLFFISFLFLSVSTSFSTKDLLSLYQMARESDPLLKKAVSALEATLEQKPLTRSTLLPKLQAQMGQGYYGKKITGLGPLEIKRDYWGDDYSIRLIQPIFNAQAYVSLKMADHSIDAKRAELLAEEQRLIKKVAIAYFNLLDARAAVVVSKNRLKLIKEVLDRANAFLEAGMGDVLSVKEAKARYYAAKAGVVNAENALSLSKENLSILVHAPVSEVADIGKFEIVGPKPDDVKKWIKAALENQPILKSAQEGLLAAEKKIEYERRARWPKIDLEAMAGYADGLFLPDVIYREAHGVLRFTIPIYLGGSISSKTAIAEKEAISARHNLSFLKDVIILQTKRAFLRLKDSISIIQAAKQALDSAKVSLKATKKGYEIGTRDVIELLDMTDKYIEAKQGLFHAIYNHLKARVELKAAAGLLGEGDIISLNGLLKDGGGVEIWER